MPRPTPPPEDEKIRTTVSLPRKVYDLAEAYRARHPEEDLRDFSAIVGRALIDYAHRKHPDLLAECIADIRAHSLKAAESPGKYGVAAPVQRQNPVQPHQQEKRKRA